MTDPKLTDIQTLALAFVKYRPGLTVEDYANRIDNTEEVYGAFGFLIYNQYIRLDPKNGTVSPKGI